MGKKQKIEWNLQNILIAIGMGVLLILTLIEVPWALIEIKYGFLPWIYKDKWGKGWKLWAFMVVYAGIETALFYALLINIHQNTGGMVVPCLYVVFFLWVWCSQWNED